MLMLKKRSLIAGIVASLLITALPCFGMARTPEMMAVEEQQNLNQQLLFGIYGGNNPLLSATQIEALIADGANPNATMVMGGYESALQLALDANRLDVARILIKNGAVVHYKLPYNGGSFLDRARRVAAGNPAMLAFLTNAANNELVAACQSGRSDYVQEILNTGYTVESVGPFQVAATNKNAVMLQLLLEHTPVDVQEELLGARRNQTGNHVLFDTLGVTYSLDDGIVRFIADEGQEPSLDEQLFLEVNQSDTEAVKALLKRGAPVSPALVNLAAENKNAAILGLLISRADDDGIIESLGGDKQLVGEGNDYFLHFPNFSYESNGGTVAFNVPEQSSPTTAVATSLSSESSSDTDSSESSEEESESSSEQPEAGQQPEHPLILAAQTGVIEVVQSQVTNATREELLRAAAAARSAGVSCAKNGGDNATIIAFNNCANYLEDLANPNPGPPAPQLVPGPHPASLTDQPIAPHPAPQVVPVPQPPLPNHPLIAAAQAGNLDQVRRLAPFASPEIRLQARFAARNVSMQNGYNPLGLNTANCVNFLAAYQPPANSFGLPMPLFCGIATAATACTIFYRSWSRKRQLSKLEHAAKTAKELVLTISFDCFNAGDRVRGLQERFDVHSILQTIGNEEKGTTLQIAIEQFDTALQAAYNKVMAHYYDKSESYFAQYEQQLINKLEISFVQLQDALTACRSEFSVGAKGWTALGIGVLATLGFASWAA